MKNLFLVLAIIIAIAGCVSGDFKGDENSYKLTVICQNVGTKMPQDLIAINLPQNSEICQDIQFVSDTSSSLIRIENQVAFKYKSYNKIERFFNAKERLTRTRSKLEKQELPEAFSLPKDTFNFNSIAKYFESKQFDTVFVYSISEDFNTINLYDRTYDIYNNTEKLRKDISNYLCRNKKNNNRNHMSIVLLYDLDLYHLIIEDAQRSHIQIINSIEALQDSIKEIVTTKEKAKLKNDKEQIKKITDEIQRLLDKDYDIYQEIKLKIERTAKTENQALEIILNEIREKQKALEQLQEENNLLKTQLDSVKNEKEKLKKKNDELADTIGAKTQELNKVQKENTELTLNLKKLNVELIEKFYYKKTKSGDFKQLDHSKKNFSPEDVDKIKLKFLIQANNYADVRNYTLYLRIIDLDGNVIQPSSDTFLYINEKNEEEPLAYTVKRIFDFNRTRKIIEIEVDFPNYEFQEGYYELYMFIDSYSSNQNGFNM